MNTKTHLLAKIMKDRVQATLRKFKVFSHITKLANVLWSLFTSLACRHLARFKIILLKEGEMRHLWCPQFHNLLLILKSQFISFHFKSVFDSPTIHLIMMDSRGPRTISQQRANIKRFWNESKLKTKSKTEPFANHFLPDSGLVEPLGWTARSFQHQKERENAENNITG